MKVLTTLLLLGVLLFFVVACGRIDTNAYYVKSSPIYNDIHYCEVKRGGSIKLVRCEEDEL
jgi:hypothetical protein